MGASGSSRRAVRVAEFRQPFDGGCIYNGQIWESLIQPQTGSSSATISADRCAVDRSLGRIISCKEVGCRYTDEWLRPPS